MYSEKIICVLIIHINNKNLSKLKVFRENLITGQT